MKKKQVPIIVEEIHLFSIKTAEQKIDTLAFRKQEKPQLKIGRNLLYNLDDEHIKIEFIFSFEDDKENKILFFQIDFQFKIENLSNFYELKEKKQPVFDGQFIATLIGICFSTARGIILEKTQNAGLQGILLPVVSPQKILKEIDFEKYNVTEGKI